MKSKPVTVTIQETIEATGQVDLYCLMDDNLSEEDLVDYIKTRVLKLN
jgi:hypothetical protein